MVSLCIKVTYGLYVERGRILRKVHKNHSTKENNIEGYTAVCVLYMKAHKVLEKFVRSYTFFKLAVPNNTILIVHEIRL